MNTELAIPEKSLIEHAFDLALPSPTVEQSSVDRLDDLIRARKSLLPVEDVSRKKLSGTIEQLDSEIRRSNYSEPLMPLDPLSWRWKNGLPKLAILPLDQGGVFSIVAKRTTTGIHSNINQDLPWQIAERYDDVLKLAQSHCVRRGSSHEFSYTFDGVIPLNVRSSIVEAQVSHRFQGLYMLVETPEKAWKVTSVKGISRRQQFQEWQANIDPLILGWAENSLWVIDKFDLTTLEDYVLTEFSSQKALPSG